MKGWQISAAVILLLTVLLVAASLWRSDEAATPDRSCISSVEELEVRGDSLSGVVESGERVRAEHDFYRCNPVRRDEIVLLRFGKNPAPIAKIVKGMPGDRFAVVTHDGKWRLAVNGEPMRNRAGEPYLLDLPARRMLSLYERDYAGVIPPDAYLVLGNRPVASTDSRRFGLVARSDLLGRLLTGENG